MEVTVTSAGGTSYMDIRAGVGHGIHQKKVNATTMAASRDADGYLPLGLPVNAAGGPVTAGDAVGIIGPEPMKLGTVNVFMNAILTGPLSRQAIEANLGRVLTAAELAGIASGLPGVRLV